MDIYFTSNTALGFLTYYKQQASAYENLRRVPNPYCCEIEGCRVLGTSGQPVDDIIRFSTQTNPLTVLQQTLEWGHIAPTAPDTLG